GQLVLDAVGPDLAKTPPCKPMKLNKGKNAIALEYQAPKEGDAFVRLYWSGPEFPAEPVPPTILSHADVPEQGGKPQAIRAGRYLAATHYCIRCHTPEEKLTVAIEQQRNSQGKLAVPAVMPELAAAPPSLAGAGSRFNEQWVAAWIFDPRALRPTASMPRPLGDPAAREQAAADIAAFLATLKSADNLPAFEPMADLTAAGGRLFASLQCAACHTLPGAPEPDTKNARVPLSHIRDKYKAAALVAFLKNPEVHYAWTPMPNFALTDVEARRVASLLLQTGTGTSSATGKGDPAKGRELFSSAGCANCHDTGDGGPTASLKAPALAQLAGDRLARGCLADASPAGTPDFGFPAAQRQALASMLALSPDSLARDHLGEFVERQIQQFNCLRCHGRDGRPDFYTANFAKEVQPLLAAPAPPDEFPADIRPASDQSPPILTWTGEKLRPQWTSHLLNGALEYRPRPWLRSRMPAFRSRAWPIALGWPMEHGFSPVPPAPPAQDVALAQIGRRLAGKDGGFACIACHGVGGAQPKGVYDAPGINFQYISERITEHYFRRWIYGPLRLNPVSKMPTFADPEGHTAIREIVDGDARRQYDAIYNYLLSGRKIEPPEN
ncbi:MAG: c-type cytochrome, partial [Tepidisphaerales bacterium]